MKKLLLLLMLISTGAFAQNNKQFSYERFGFNPPAQISAGLKAGDTFIVTDVPYLVKPPAPLYLIDSTGKQYAKNTVAKYSGTSRQPGKGALTYQVIATPTFAQARTAAPAIVTPSVAAAAAVTAAAQARARTRPLPATPATGATGRMQTGAQGPRNQPRIAGPRSSSNAPQPSRVAGTLATQTPGAQAMHVPTPEEIVQPNLPPPLKVAVPTGGYHEGTHPFYTGFQAPAPRPIAGQIAPGTQQQAGVNLPYIQELEKELIERRRAAQEPIAIPIAKHATVEEAGGLEELEGLEQEEKLASAARKVREATGKLREQAQRNTLLDAINKENVNRVRSILESGVLPNDFTLW